MSLSTLPDVVLRKLFSYFPLQTLVHCGQVCKSWVTLRATELSKRRTITLYIDKTYNPKEVCLIQNLNKKLDHFAIPYLHELQNQATPLYMNLVVCKHFKRKRTSNGICKSFPNIKHIRLIYNRHFENIFHGLWLLLGLVGWSLDSLKIFATNDDLPYKQTQLGPHDLCELLLNALNQYAPNLRQLTVYTAHQLCPCSNQSDDGFDCQWYSQITAPLEELNLIFKESLLDAQDLGVLASVVQDGDFDFQCQVRIFRDRPNLRFIRKYARIFNSYQITYLNGIRANLKEEINFALKCTSLQYLGLIYDSTSKPREHLKLPKLAFQLKSLPNLICLELTINCNNQISLFRLCGDPTHVPQLTQIKILKLNLQNLQNHNVVYSVLWAAIFPSLEVLIITGIHLNTVGKCKKCSYEKFFKTVSKKNCFEQMIDNFKDCSKLRRLIYDYKLTKMSYSKVVKN